MDGAILATLFNLTPSFCSPARQEVFGLCPEQLPARAGGVAGECGVAGRGPGGGARGVVPAPVSSVVEVIILIANRDRPLDVKWTRK